MAKTKKMTPGMAYVLRLKEQQRQRANAVSFTPTDLEREDLSKQAGRPVTDAEIIRGNIHGPAPQFAPVFPKPQPRTDYDDEIREAEEEVLREAESKLSAAQKRLLHAQRKAAEQIQQQAAAENRQAYIQAVAPQLRELHVIRDRAAFSSDYTPDEYFAILNAISQLEFGPEADLEAAVQMVQQVKATDARKQAAKLSAVKAKLAELNGDREDLEAMLASVGGRAQTDDQPAPESDPEPEPFRFDDGSIAARLDAIAAKLKGNGNVD